MKSFSVLLFLVALMFGDVAIASAVATSVTGTTTVQTGTAPQRPLRTGDRVNQGDTVSTGAASSVVLKFEDGQVAALTANSRMTVTGYSYQRETQRGNSLLSLVNGGMRFITGVIGKNSPQTVSVRAATATIGIRGTALTCVTESGVVFCQVDEGKVSFTFNGQTIEIDVGRAALAQATGVSQGTISQIQAALQGTDAGRAISQALGGLAGLTSVINQAFPGVPTQGQPAPAAGDQGTGTGTGVGSPTGPSGGGGGGGGQTGSPS